MAQFDILKYKVNRSIKVSCFWLCNFSFNQHIADILRYWHFAPNTWQTFTSLVGKGSV